MHNYILIKAIKMPFMMLMLVLCIIYVANLGVVSKMFNISKK